MVVKLKTFIISAEIYHSELRNVVKFFFFFFQTCFFIRVNLREPKRASVAVK